jgi:hypothetical protein
MRPVRAVLKTFPPLQRAQIVELDCTESIAKVLQVTYWASHDLAREVMSSGAVESNSASMVRRILQRVDLQPHRTRYWKTSHLDEQLKERAEKALWCYAKAVELVQQGQCTVCVDEIPNFEVLKRIPSGLPFPVQLSSQSLNTCVMAPSIC